MHENDFIHVHQISCSRHMGVFTISVCLHEQKGLLWHRPTILHLKMQFVRNVVEYGPADICFPSARYAVTLPTPPSD